MEYLSKTMRLDSEIIAWLNKLKEMWGSYNKGLRKVAFSEHYDLLAVDVVSDPQSANALPGWSGPLLKPRDR
jgi:hypothetical protein